MKAKLIQFLKDYTVAINIEDERKAAQNGQNDIVENKEEDTSKIEKLKQELKQKIKEEKYEEAAKLRDEIKKLENK